MNAYKRYKNRLEQFLQTERGKRFINFAYSFGAAIVILGAMCKLLHFPFGNEIFFIGMTVEFLVFILSAFDSPIRDYRWEEVFPVLSSMDSKKNSSLNTAMAQQIPDERSHTATSVAETHPTASDHSPLSTAPHSHSTTAPIDPGYEILPNLSTHSEEYGKQMENLNRTLSGLNSIYEIQLKSVSSQIGTIEQINQGLARLRNIYDDRLPDGSVIKTETEKMADQLRELNEVYARMLNAMTVIKPDNRNNSNS